MTGTKSIARLTSAVPNDQSAGSSLQVTAPLVEDTIAAVVTRLEIARCIQGLGRRWEAGILRAWHEGEITVR